MECIRSRHCHCKLLTYTHYTYVCSTNMPQALPHARMDACRMHTDNTHTPHTPHHTHTHTHTQHTHTTQNTHTFMLYSSGMLTSNRNFPPFQSPESTEWQGRHKGHHTPVAISHASYILSYPPPPPQSHIQCIVWGALSMRAK